MSACCLSTGGSQRKMERERNVACWSEMGGQPNRVNQGQGWGVDLAHTRRTGMERAQLLAPHLTVQAFTVSLKVGKSWLLKLNGHFFSSCCKLYGITNWGTGGLGPTFQMECRPLAWLPGSGKMRRKSFGMKQANKHSPKQNNTKTPHRKLSTCKHVFVTAKGLGLQHLGVFGPKPEDSAVFPEHLK